MLVREGGGGGGGGGVVFVKPEKNLIFLKNGKNSKIVEMIQGSLKIFLDLG